MGLTRGFKDLWQFMVQGIEEFKGWGLVTEILLDARGTVNSTLPKDNSLQWARLALSVAELAGTRAFADLPNAEFIAAPLLIFIASYSIHKVSALAAWILGFRIRGTLGDIDPLNKVPFKRARSGVG